VITANCTGAQSPPVPRGQVRPVSGLADAGGADDGKPAPGGHHVAGGDGQLFDEGAQARRPAPNRVVGGGAVGQLPGNVVVQSELGEVAQERRRGRRLA